MESKRWRRQEISTEGPLNMLRLMLGRESSSLPRKRSSASLASLDSISLQPRSQGIFTPNLPQELWLHILQFAASDNSDDADGFCPYVYKRSKYAQVASHHSPTHSFLSHPPAHTHLPERLAKYNARLRWKASLTRICRLFNLIAQEVLFQEVWISSSKDGRRMAARLGGVSPDPMPMGVVSTITSAASSPKKDKSWWKSTLKGKSRQHDFGPMQHTITHRRSYSAFPNNDSPDPGRFIRHLRIETPALDKCSPHDLLLILQHCPLLSIFEDCRSIRRPMHPLIVSSSEVVPFGSGDTLTTDALSQAILSRPLKRMTWTNYAHDSQDFERGVRLYSDVVGPLLDKVGHGLEVLEVVNCAEGLGMGARGDRSSWNIGKGSFGMLTNLEYSVTTTTSSQSSSLLPPPNLILPSLTSLKATLDNATFTVLSTWSMPVLRNLSVISADFGYGAEGFKEFFEIHGSKIEQLEFGHSSGEVEEFWVTERHQTGQQQERFRIPLDAWCPNLREFICSADAEWNWQSPDWIAPHVLLPAHAGLEFIGVKGMERRLVGDLEESLRRRRERYYAQDAEDNMDEDEDDPYFMLLQQFGSLLRLEAFPSLRYVRDMSWESDVMRRTGRMHLEGDTPVPSPTSSPSTSRPSTARKLLSKASFAHLDQPQPQPILIDQARVHGSKALRYWMAVLDKCRERGVWLEDWRGVNVTMGDLRRANAGVV
ncbi:hypothetical protein CPB83DRAFT_910133 [Crepidotus variabilis]|uniref:Uncharacterized protein n=1 Tax=Crepidotus variabilis TaxID=179855 RepID=A0A9P6E812_9AGAR|nr:hypothetical protein CPB83DRAFT_910133 [Crepidotus variabilis]